MRIWLIKKLLLGLTRGEKRQILSLAVSDLFNTISDDDILKQKGDEWSFQGKTLPSKTVELLKAEASQLRESKLWQVLQADVYYQANKKLFVDGGSLDAIFIGRSWYYVFDVIKTRLKKM